jgi:hypothetical protein
VADPIEHSPCDVHGLIRLAAQLRREEEKARQDSCLNQDRHGCDRNEDRQEIFIHHTRSGYSPV